ncbi:MULTISPECIES: carbohydrate ABC transporter permease [unclassified Rhizobium]|uniref:carbohydrate ABC transporter permease n=1 Tax=unclassified Rhizobium TaxID=2613769 RepID=UPI0007E96915|nr:MULTISPECIES: carbohydrate ABC transporter permease [unclassified Rhizobium]ANM14445.1 sugar ABC transporter permease protein [Rhizobium sp. N324]ANM20830.1 sugar ABC transporter permease protein [Rhizobium sp. N541]ANM27213.1 sugar ABC transporter permease protein [Rhizobium sp. N941]OWV85822.1 ABC transporter permease [Rhizobium sp. N122]OYC99544.1 sugar ABC transporter permease protein [Rhizobium sp. N4311]
MNAVSFDRMSTPPSGLIANRPRRLTWARLVSNSTALLLALFFSLPMLWLILASVDHSATNQLKLPELTAEHYWVAVQADNLAALANSLLLSTVATVVGTTAAFVAAYVFSKHNIPFKNPLLLTILFLSGVPISILIVPVYKMFTILGWLSIVPTGILLGVTAIPFQIYQLKNFIDAIPPELEEAAALEQATTLQILYRVILPLTKPGLASSAIFGFVNAWGNFLMPVVLINSLADQPAPVHLFGFMGSNSIDYGAIAAYSLIYSLPVIVLFLGMSHQFKAGFSLGGAVK